MRTFSYISGLILALVLSFGLSGCGGGSSSTQANNTAGVNQAILGPLSGATIYAYRLNDLNTSIETVISNNSLTDLTKAGSFNLALVGIPADEWLVVKAIGGVDIDANDDGVLDINTTQNNGTIYCIAKASDLKSGINITAISDIIYRRLVSENSLADLNSSALSSKINELASEQLEDVDGDGNITYKDMVGFLPRRDKAKSKVDWNTLLNTYIFAIHSNNDDSLLQDRLDFMTETSVAGYRKETNSTALFVKVQGVETSIIKTIDTDLNGNANAAIIEQSKGKLFAKTKIYQNSAGENGFKYKIINENGDTLTILFNGIGNLLTGMSENDLQDLADSGQISFEESSDANGTYIKLDFPKSIMSLWSMTDVNIKVNNTYVRKDYLTVINNDPTIGWHFDDTSHDSVDYTVPGNSGGAKNITQEPLVLNNGGIKFRYVMAGSGGSCQNDETEVTKITDFYDGKISSDNNDYVLCAKHANLDLKTGSGTRLFSYDPNTDLVSARMLISNNAKEVYLGTVSDNYKIVTKISKDTPTEMSLDGWSAAISFKSMSDIGFIGDAEYTDSKLWVAVKRKSNLKTLIEGKTYYTAICDSYEGEDNQTVINNHVETLVFKTDGILMDTWTEGNKQQERDFGYSINGGTLTIDTNGGMTYTNVVQTTDWIKFNRSDKFFFDYTTAGTALGNCSN